MHVLDALEPIDGTNENFFLSGSFYLPLPGRRRLACRRVRVGVTPLSIARFPENRGVGIAIGSADESKEQHAVVQHHSATVADQLLLDTMEEVVEQMEMKELEASNRLGRACTSPAHQLQAAFLELSSATRLVSPYTRMQGALLTWKLKDWRKKDCLLVPDRLLYAIGRPNLRQIVNSG